MTDTLGQSQVIPYLIGLSKSGYSITLISCEKPASYQRNSALISSLLKENNIDWHPLFYTKKPPVLSTLWDMFKMNRKIRQLHLDKDFKVVHCRSYITSLLGEKFCKKNNIPFVFDMRGFWADERVEGTIWNLKNPIFKWIYNYFKRKELDFVNTAAAIVSLTHAGKREIQSWKILPSQKHKITVIPCSADFDLFVPATALQRKKARANAGIDESDFVIAYLGSIGTWYLLDEMLDFFSICLKQNPQSKFYVLTGDSKQELYAKAKSKGIPENSLMVEFAERKQVPEKLAAADWGISFIKPSFSKTASSPTKMGEMLAMGIPLIVNGNVGDVQEIIEQVGGGLCIMELNHASYIEAIEKMGKYDSNDRNKIRMKSKEIYHLQKAIDSYVSIYNSILK